MSLKVLKRMLKDDSVAMVFHTAEVMGDLLNTIIMLCVVTKGEEIMRIKFYKFIQLEFY
ncbi:MAG: hypothetical protein GY928_03020 [Colwellia sp.]|nr:hypothetical protein [Colwellia sp.]